ncbi:MAG TPA: Gfo/Idh/MocA family oxidoreductase [Armatimonadota bacterium]|nr:Gfo/Idh/MocA family oxidoreductase [Armatimonadota bacterium]HOS43277.1 Gfo/Idh/MocA family oxidoreductase [Armatimonadota bacterium]
MGISLGLVGLGAFGSAFAELFKSHPLVDRVALCDREAARVAHFANSPAFRDKFSPKDAYTSLDDICRSDVDALVIITQHWLHAPQCVQAMEHGKHVYSAVPVISIPDGDETLAWCDRIIETTRRTGQHYMLGETTYYHAGAMYCRRKAAEGAFGHFVYSEGEYYHSFDSPCCDLREVIAHRLASAAGQEWAALLAEYRRRGAQDGPMHYPTHSTSGPLSVMRAHPVKVCGWGTPVWTDDAYFHDGLFPFSNETALYQLSNGATMRICEHRHCGLIRETFRVYGTEAAFENDTWIAKEQPTALTAAEMRDPLPPEVYAAFAAIDGNAGVYDGHGGSHAYLVHEFVDAIAHGRRPAINAWDAARYTAAGVMAHKSALKDGEVLAVPDWGDAPA